MSQTPFGPPPNIPFEAQPSADEIAFFRENGFLAVERITTDAEVDWLAGVYEHLFDPARADEGKAPLDRSGVLRPEVAGKLTQVFHPELQIPQLLDTTYFRNCRRYAAALLGADLSALTGWGHMIRKAPGGRVVSWHQDLAFWPPELDYCALNVWLPMHDVAVEMGAMQFIPGSHKRGVLRHRHEDEPVQNLLTLDEAVDLSTAVACPLRKGGCTFHHPATLHFTAVNTTTRPRLAFAATFQTEPVMREAPRVHPWMDEHRAALGGRRQTTYVADGKVLPLPTQPLEA
jgi:hypothetical protein